jgi:hypothetical protein
MRSLAYRAAAATALISVAACSGVTSSSGSGALLPNTVNADFARIAPAQNNTSLYVATGSNVLAFHPPKNKPPFCTISNGTNIPVDVDIDGQGNTYVANFGGPSVSVYPANCGTLSTTINVTYGSPTSVVVSGSTIYVGAQDSMGYGEVNVCTLSGCTGELKIPSSIYTKYPEYQLNAVAVDHDGNVYANGFINVSVGAPANVLVEWPGGSSAGKIVKGYYNKRLEAKGPFAAQAIAFDTRRNLMAGYFSGSGGYLVVYHGCPRSCKPHVFHLIHPSPDGLAINNAGSKVYVADFGAGVIDVYAYRGTSGIKYESTISDGLSKDGPGGLAIFPPAQV